MFAFCIQNNILQGLTKCDVDIHTLHIMFLSVFWVLDKLNVVRWFDTRLEPAQKMLLTLEVANPNNHLSILHQGSS